MPTPFHILAAGQDRLFGLDSQTLVQVAVQLLNACVLAGVLSWLLYKPVRKFMARRAAGIQAQFDSAGDDRAMADKLKALYEQKLEEIERERAGILEAARRQGDDLRAQMLEEAEKELASLREQAAAELLAERGRAQEALRLRVIGAASLMAEKVVALAMDPADQDRLFAETLAELGDAL